MVDPVDLRFGEMRPAWRSAPRRGQIAAKGLFHHDPAPGIGDAMAVQPFGQIAEQAPRNRRTEK
jgi:hypothetical protein